MDRYISSTATMNSVCRSVFCFKSVVVSVAILGGPALLHARTLLRRWAPLGWEQTPEAAAGFALA